MSDEMDSMEIGLTSAGRETAIAHHAAAHLREAVAEAAHLLPAQGPIGVFIHHNTLHAFQHLPFHEAVAQASAEFETHGYLPEAEYRACYQRGRISAGDLDAVLSEWLAEQPGPPAIGAIARTALARIALLHELPVESEASLRWRIDERGVLDRFRPDVAGEVQKDVLARGVAWLREHQSSLAGVIADLPRLPLDRDPEAWVLRALWAACVAVSSRMEGTPERAILDRVPHERGHRDLVRAVTGEDPATLVNPFLIRFTAAYLDQGMAHWPMPERARGLMACFRALASVGTLPPALDHVPAMLAEHERLGMSAEAIVLDALRALDVPAEHHAAYLGRVLLQLPGWAGMIHRLETHPDEREPAMGEPSLMEYLAVRLTCDRSALAYLARRALGYTGPISGLLEHVKSMDPGQHPGRPARDEAAFRLFSACQLAGLAPQDVWAMSHAERQAIVDWLDDFDEVTRRRIWHEAYERHYGDEILHALHVARRRQVARKDPPRFQVWFCIDDREESIRRHLEELLPDIETFGTAGFFGLAIDFVALNAPEAASLCPIAVSPAHEVHELPHQDDEELHEQRTRRQGLLARISHFTHRGTRSLVPGTLLTPLIGMLATFPMITRVLFPRLAERLRSEAERLLLPAPRTLLTSSREPEGERNGDGKPLGFLLAEQIDRIAATLQNVGSTRDFAPLILVLGHGSISVNNPHKSAYDCGACGGRDGGPNARLFAEIANRPEVRAGLRARGIDIPDQTIFVGGSHNTSNDEVVLFDAERIPAERAAELAELRAALRRARTLDAHERCRRFEHAPLDLTPEQALHHVEERTNDLSQVRPECGHATNAACIVGRRQLTRGLFLDRRAFLVSYDPDIDPDGRILERILAAVGPVGAGINLEYYFSFIDNDRYGSGTKLPHNVTAMLGVMDGHASDLRTGLPWEMVEIHEPVRLLTVVESTPEVLLAICERQPAVRELVVGGWILIATVDPDDGRMHRFVPGRGFVAFEPGSGDLPTAASSMEWYRGHRSFVPVAWIDPQARERTGGRGHAR